MALQLAGQADVRLLLRQAGEWLLERAGVECVVIYLHEPAANRLAKPICLGVSLSDLPEAIKLGYSIYGEVAMGRRPYYIELVEREKTPDAPPARHAERLHPAADP